MLVSVRHYSTLRGTGPSAPGRGPEAAAMTDLIVEFVDEAYPASPDAPLTFGRAGDVVIDEANQFMHRVVGAFVYDGDTWWIRNEARRFELDVVAGDGRRSTLPPGAGEPLTTMRGTVRFTAGVTTYELLWDLHDVRTPAIDIEPVTAPVTREFGVVALNVEQRQLLAALAVGRLHGEPDAAIPANAEVAHRLGWSQRKFDRKLDYLCRRLSEVGVPGLRGQKGAEAVDRRAKLLDHVVAAGMITAADLDLLPS